MTFLSRPLALAVGLYLGYMLLQEDHFSRNDLFRGVITGILLLYGIRGNHLLTLLGLNIKADKDDGPQTDYFVPQFLYEQYDAEKLEGSLTAVALLLAIHGFDNIPALYSEPEGEDGPALQHMAEQIFGPAIRAVYSHGGFVANFFEVNLSGLLRDGDPLANERHLIALFPGNDPLPAIEAAQIIRDHLHRPQNTLFGISQALALGDAVWKISFPPPWVFSRTPSQTWYGFTGVTDNLFDAVIVGDTGDIILTRAIADVLPETLTTASVDDSEYRRLTNLRTVEGQATSQASDQQIPLPHQPDFHRISALLSKALGLHEQAVQQYDLAATAAKEAANPRVQAIAMIERSYLQIDMAEQSRLYIDRRQIQQTVARLLAEATAIRRQADDPNGLLSKPIISTSGESGVVHTLTLAGAFQSWELTAEQPVETKSLERVNCLARSIDGQVLATSQDRKISCWQAGETAPFSEFDVRHQPQQIFIHPQNHLLATVNHFEFNETVSDTETFPFVQIWDCQSGQLLHTIQTWLPLTACITDLAFIDPEWQFIAFGVRYLAPYEWDRTRLYVCPLDRDYILKHRGMHRYQGATMTAMTFSQECRLLVVGLSDTGRHPDEDAGFKLHFWSDPNKPSSKGVTYRHSHWKRGHQGRINWLLFNETQQTVISGSADKSIKIWGLSEHAFARILDGHKGAVLCGLLNPEGTLLAAGDDTGSIVIWRLYDGAQLHTVKAHQSAVSSLTLSPDGAYIVSVSKDGVPSRCDWRGETK